MADDISISHKQETEMPEAPANDLSPLEKKQTEALKALADWSKWLITLETALSTALIAIIAQGHGDGWLGAALVCFFVSIFFAAMLMGAIPDALQVVPIEDKDGQNLGIYAYKQFHNIKWPPPTRILWHAFFEHVFAVLGLFLVLIFGILHITW